MCISQADLRVLRAGRHNGTKERSSWNSENREAQKPIIPPRAKRLVPAPLRPVIELTSSIENYNWIRTSQHPRDRARYTGSKGTHRRAGVLQQFRLVLSSSSPFAGAQDKVHQDEGDDSSYTYTSRSARQSRRTGSRDRDAWLQAQCSLSTRPTYPPRPGSLLVLVLLSSDSDSDPFSTTAEPASGVVELEGTARTTSDMGWSL